VKPSLLIASPQLKDPFFERTVVLLWHHDEQGAIGVVINRMLEHTMSDVLAMPEPVDLSDYEDNAVGWGGPVETTSGTVITRAKLRKDEGWKVAKDIGVTRSQEALVRLVREGADLLLCLGYAGWGPGQLDNEIAQGGWLWTEPSAELVFDAPVDARYDRALATLGLTPTTVWMKPIDAD
jgi:putative transcriptional regulator